MTNKRFCLVRRGCMSIAAAGIAGFLLPIQVSIAGPIQVKVSFDEEVRAEAATGRVLLLLCDDRGRGRNPLTAPFWTDPQPIFSVGVTDLKPGETAVFTEDAKGFPGALGQLKGKYTIAAVLDVDRTTDGFRLSPHNLHSELNHVEFGADNGDEPLVVTLPLTKHFSPRQVQST